MVFLVLPELSFFLCRLLPAGQVQMLHLSDLLYKSVASSGGHRGGDHTAPIDHSFGWTAAASHARDDSEVVCSGALWIPS